jgi:hypothetical protein
VPQCAVLSPAARPDQPCARIAEALLGANRAKRGAARLSKCQCVSAHVHTAQAAQHSTAQRRRGRVAGGRGSRGRRRYLDAFSSSHGVDRPVITPHSAPARQNPPPLRSCEILMDRDRLLVCCLPTGCARSACCCLLSVCCLAAVFLAAAARALLGSACAARCHTATACHDPTPS